MKRINKVLWLLLLATAPTYAQIDGSFYFIPDLCQTFLEVQ
ncbi:hypothetical protein ACFSSG_12165 [Euzebyella marina]|nr:hypothetical protein [Euzebyella marina]